MKHIDEYYKDWCGTSHIENSCHPVHDSAETIEFAEYYYNEISNNEQKEKYCNYTPLNPTKYCKKGCIACVHWHI